MRLRSMADWVAVESCALLMPALADWAAGSARRRESCLQMGCYALVLSALRQAIVRRLRQAMVSRLRQAMVSRRAERV